MTRFQQFVLWIGAATCWGAALLIVAQAGLPERAAYTGYIEAGQRVAPELNAVAPPFTLPALTSNSVELADLRGGVVILNFWATWCEPCKVEMPELQGLYHQYAPRGLRIVAVNVGENLRAVQQWVDTFRLTFDVLLDESQQAAAVYQLRGQPTSFVITPDGIITYIVYGPANRDALETAIAPFLANG